MIAHREKRILIVKGEVENQRYSLPL